MEEPKVFLACPYYGQVEFGMAQAAYQATATAEVHLYPSQDSRLPHNFNRLWCAALNTRATEHWTHFAMLHSDVVPPAGWLDVLLAEQQALGVQLVAAVVPIKDDRGLTSTGLFDQHKGVIRLSMQEVFDLPETFEQADICCQTEMPLVVNTGCWVCDFTQSWVEKVAFRFVDEIVQVDGRFEARTMSEDWHFSLQLAALGVSIAATRKMALAHVGPQEWRNDHAWGSVSHDPGGR